MRFSNDNTIEDAIRRIACQFSPDEEYIIYGTGECFKFIRWILGDLLKIKFCIDQKAQQGEYMVNGIVVYAPEKLRKQLNCKIIITANGEYYDEIKELLQEFGYSEKQLCSAAEILMVWGTKYKNVMASMYVSFPVLSACTLNCNGCIHYTNYHKKHFYLDKEEFEKSVDLYFKCIDFVDQIQVFGGEPFLHKEIGELCSYISDCYGDRYQKMLITTNGTIIPKQTDMDILKKCTNLVVSISDYSGASEKVKIDEIIRVCEKNGVEYWVNSNFYRSDVEELWFDCGNPTELKSRERERFSKCSLTGCGVYKNRYYYCPNSMFADLTDIHKNLEDWINLEDLSILSKEERNQILQAWHLGFIKKENLDFCAYCNGFGKKVNQNWIKAGVQL